jgi:predicted KAP-like P-loop ATPase
MRVFPKVESAWTNHGYSHEFLGEWRRKRRACSPEHFYTYFRLTLSSDALPAALFNEFLEHSHQEEYVADFLKKLASQRTAAGRSNAERFLELIQDYTEDAIRVESIPAILGGLYRMGDSLLATHDTRPGNFELGIDAALGRVQWQLLKRLERGHREELLLGIASTAPAISLLVRELSVFDQQQGGSLLRALIQKISGWLEGLFLLNWSRSQAAGSHHWQRRINSLMCHTSPKSCFDGAIGQVGMQ